VYVVLNYIQRQVYVHIG